MQIVKLAHLLGTTCEWASLYGEINKINFKRCRINNFDFCSNLRNHRIIRLKRCVQLTIETKTNAVSFGFMDHILYIQTNNIIDFK